MSGISPVISAAIKIQARVRGQQLRNQQLLQAAKIGDIKRTKNLIKHGANVNVTNIYGETVLQLAAFDGFVEIVQLLLDKGAEVNATNKYGITALHFAAVGQAQEGYEEIVQLLVKAGADINARDIWGNTALQRATTFGHNVKLKNAIEEGKTDLINLAKAIPMIAKHLEKSLNPDVILDIMSYANINKSQKIQAKKYMKARGIFYTEREEAAAATKIQAMARGNQGRK
ncbi:hypothetical protein CL658_00940 [bacterium]|nr:hypothetical protein [bacterium]